MEKLRDIKDIVEVNEYSFEILLAIIFFSLVLLFVIWYLFKNRRKKRRKLTKKEIALQNLKNINYENTKELVYTFTQNAYLFVDEKNQDEFEKIENLIERYKYKKDIPQMQDEKELIKEFVKKIKV